MPSTRLPLTLEISGLCIQRSPNARAGMTRHLAVVIPFLVASLKKTQRCDPVLSRTSRVFCAVLLSPLPP